jgi:hypothetical protein
MANSDMQEIMKLLAMLGGSLGGPQIPEHLEPLVQEGEKVLEEMKARFTHDVDGEQKPHWQLLSWIGYMLGDVSRSARVRELSRTIEAADEASLAIAREFIEQDEVLEQYRGGSRNAGIAFPGMHLPSVAEYEEAYADADPEDRAKGNGATTDTRSDELLTRSFTAAVHAFRRTFRAGYGDMARVGAAAFIAEIERLNAEYEIEHKGYELDVDAFVARCRLLAAQAYQAECDADAAQQRTAEAEQAALTQIAAGKVEAQA